MADAVQKFLAKVSKKEKVILLAVMEKILSGKTTGLQVKKLTGVDGVFRVRKGDFRVLYKQGKSDCSIISIDRRSEGTYKNF